MDKKDKYFIRLGPMSGQKQKHKTGRVAPVKRGVWALPVGIIHDLGWLGCHKFSKQIEKDFEKLADPEEKRSSILEVTPNDKLYKKLWKDARHKHYKKIHLKYTDNIWTHFPRNPRHLSSEWEWFECSVREYWERYRYWVKNFRDGELFEIFIEM